MKMKNRDAPFICRNRVIHPTLTSRIMWITELNADDVSAV